jgi:glycosyltransferase involved in cell wall biosynthesis
MGMGSLSILVLIQGDVGDRIAGPSVRGWEMSKALAQRHRVTAATPRPIASRMDGVKLVPFKRRTVIAEARRHDAVIAPTLPPYLFTALAGVRTITVADQFGPVELEHATLGDDPLTAWQVETKRAMRRLQLRFADVVTAANGAQLDRLMADLRRDQRRAGAPPRVVTVPFGLPDPPPTAAERPLRNGFPGIEPRDFVILWWSSIWRWLDAETALRAFARVVEARPQAKLVLPGGRAPSAHAEIFASTNEARQLAADLGLLGRSVFFLEEWVPYARRHAFLQDADLGLVLHRDTPEARVAARSRYLDYIWCGTPCVLARGDDLAREMAESGFAEVVSPRDPEAAAKALMSFIEDPGRRERASAAASQLADRYRWPALVDPLIGEIEQAVAARSRRMPRAQVALAASGYYGRRLCDSGAGVVKALRSRLVPATD